MGTQAKGFMGINGRVVWIRDSGTLYFPKIKHTRIASNYKIDHNYNKKYKTIQMEG